VVCISEEENILYIESESSFPYISAASFLCIYNSNLKTPCGARGWGGWTGIVNVAL
jgi:hypothetical protein